MIKKGKMTLTYEILVLIIISLAIATATYFILSLSATSLYEEYVFNNDIILDEIDYYRIENLIFTMSLLIALFIFLIIFFALLSKKMSVIKELSKGIEEIKNGNLEYKVDVKGENELADLAISINQLASLEKGVKEKEKALKKEKNELIRTLTHDIRTPLTSVISYTDYLLEKENINDEELKCYLGLVLNKANQIKDLTYLLLDGSKREFVFYDNIQLLFNQLIEEFTDELDENYALSISTNAIDIAGGYFDVNELRRIFDNLSSNIIKYADPKYKVELKIFSHKNTLVIEEKNKVLANHSQDGYGIGIKSIKRIAENYQGFVDVDKDNDNFKITIKLNL